MQWFKGILLRGAGYVTAAARRGWVWCRHLHIQSARGQGLVEYALILVLIAVVVIGVVSQVGGRTSEVFSSVSCALDGGDTASHPGNPQGGGGGIGNNTTGGC